MLQRFCVIFFLSFLLAGCSFISKSIVKKQEWSENYASAKGVEATSPLMVDRDPSTLAETQLPAGSSSAGATRFTEAVVKLPEAKSIRKIVIRSPNLRSFIVYAGGKTEDDWKSLKEIKNNDEQRIVMTVSAVTDRIRIRVLRTSDDTTLPGGRGSQVRLQHAPGKIQEIEVYGFVEEKVASAVPSAKPDTVPVATSGTPAVPGQPAEEVPKAPPIAVSLETTQNTYALTGPIPLKINLKIGSDNLTVLEDHVVSKMLSTKLIVKTASGERITCSKPIPPLSSPRPYRSGDRPVDVRNAKTLEADSSVTIDIPNLLEYYPIKDPGTYTVQFSTLLEIHDKFVGREQTEKEDLERRIRDVNSRQYFTPEEKASITQSIREEIQQLEKSKPKRYIAVGARGKPLELNSNILELVIQ